MPRKYFPMQTLTAALLTMQEDLIKQSATEIVFEDRYDAAAQDAIEEAVLLGWDGHGLDELLDSEACEYFDVLATIAKYAIGIKLSSDQALRMLERCREQRHPEITWDYRAGNALSELARNAPLPAQLKCSRAFEEYKKERDETKLKEE